MTLMKILLSAVVVLCIGTLATAWYCFRVGFYEPRKKVLPVDAPDLPRGEIYEAHWDSMRKWIAETRQTPCEEIQIRSFDGLRLRGKLYEYAPDAPVELMFHGYRGSAQRDLCGGMQRAFRLGHSALIVDQRCSGGSEGKVITFGIREHRDCLSWISYAQGRFGPERKLILTGISMGAATVMMAAGETLPENVIGVLADCGYSSPKAIIMDVIGKMGLPPRVIWPLVRLGAILFGGFDPEENSPVESMARCSVPVIFFHGKADDYVPCRMSRENYEACRAVKRLVTVPEAGHGLSYPVAPEEYVEELKKFFDPLEGK